MFLIGATSSAIAQTYLPSIKIGTAALITPAAANTYYGSSTTSTDGLAGLTGAATPVPLEIVQLARSLKNDPDLIYQYVENNIQTEWMYGLQKGALGAEIDKSGTPFDQAELMVALLRQAGYTTSYVAGTVLFNQAQFAAWSGITDSLAACQLLSGGGIPATINGNTTSTTCAAGFTAGTPITSVRMAHIWVRVTIPDSQSSGCSSMNVCVFDPSYKNYAWKAGIDLAAATQMGSGDPLSAATTGSTDCTASGVPCVNGLNTVGTDGLNSKLLSYSSKLLSYLHAHHMQGAQIEDIVSGGVITPSKTPIRQAILPYADSIPPYAPLVWTPPSEPARYNAIPNRYRATLETHGMVTHYNSDGTNNPDTTAFDPTFYADEIYGRKLVVNTDFHLNGLGGEEGYYRNNISLVFDGITIATYCNNFGDLPCPSGGGASPRGLSAHIRLTANHPYAAANDGSTSATGGYMNASIDKQVMLTLPLTIVHGWGDTSRELFTKWSGEEYRDTALPPFVNQPYCVGGTETCPNLYFQPTGNVEREKTAADYLAQMTRATQLNAAIAHSVEQIHHVLGFVYGDTQYLIVYNQSTQHDQGPPDWHITDSYDRIDVDMGISLASKTAVAQDRRAALQSIAAAAAAIEGSISAQMSDVPDTGSTATRFEWANLPPQNDAKQNPSALGPRSFYQFDSTHAPSASVLQVEGSTTALGNGYSQINEQPSIGPTEVSRWQTTLASEIQSYATQGFSVVSPKEVFLGPGQRAGTIQLSTGNQQYSHWVTKQRGGAFVATKYDTNGVDPLEIAHIQVGFMDLNGTAVVAKGGGGGIQPDNGSSYNPSTAADILKSQFVDRSNALGVNLSNGSMSYQSPASLRVGNGGFPYELTGTMNWNPAPPNKSYGLSPPTVPQSGWASNWQNQLALSGSGFEAMGQSDVRDAAGAIAAFLAAQDIYKASVSPAREASAVLAMAWWSDQIPGNVATVSLGTQSRQLVRLPTNQWIQPGTGYATLVQHGTRTPYEYLCAGGPYAMSRGWDASNVSFDVTNAGGDVQHFENWTNTYALSDNDDCGRLRGFRLTTWTFPQNVSITVSYSPLVDGATQLLTKVSNSLGREIDFRSVNTPLDSFDNGLSGVDRRSVTINQVSGQKYATFMLDPNGKQTSFLYDQTSLPCPCRPSVFPELSYVFTADKPDSSNLANANTEWDYDTLGRVYQVKDAVAIQKGTRGPYQFYIADGTRGERDDPLGQAYSVVYDTYGHPSRYIDEMAHETDALFDSRGRVTQYVYPEGDCEAFAYDDHNNTTDFWKIDTASACNRGAGSNHVLHASAVWDLTWDKPHLITNARGFTTELDYYTSGTGKISQLQQVIRPTITEGTPTYTFDYDTMGRLTDATDAAGVTTHNTYTVGSDGFSNLYSTAVDVSHFNLKSYFGYDAQGDVISTTDPRTFVVTSIYDKDRRKIEDDHHNGDANAALNAASKTIYDEVGRDKEDDAGTAFSGLTVNAWQTMKTTTYTPTSKVDAVTDADGRVTDNTYDDGDRILTVADPKSRKTHFIYCLPGDADCAANQVKKEIRAWSSLPNCSSSGTLQECYRRPTYWPDGELKTVQDANSNTTAYDYDAGGV